MQTLVQFNDFLFTHFAFEKVLIELETQYLHHFEGAFMLFPIVILSNNALKRPLTTPMSPYLLTVSAAFIYEIIQHVL
jgi:hypothetical protein